GHVAAIPFLRVVIDAAGQETDLGHRERGDLQPHVLARKLDRALERRDFGGRSAGPPAPFSVWARGRGGGGLLWGGGRGGVGRPGFGGGGKSGGIAAPDAIVAPNERRLRRRVLFCVLIEQTSWNRLHYVTERGAMIV